jgi:hypothetical protein
MPSFFTHIPLCMKFSLQVFCEVSFLLSTHAFVGGDKEARKIYAIFWYGIEGKHELLELLQLNHKGERL